MRYAQQPAAPEIWTAVWQQHGADMTFTGRPARVESHVNRMLSIAYPGELLEVLSQEVPYDQLRAEASAPAPR